MSFAYPDYAKDLMLNGMLDPKKCCTCYSMCTQIMRDGGRTGCVIKDKEAYGQIYIKNPKKAGQKEGGVVSDSKSETPGKNQ